MKPYSGIFLLYSNRFEPDKLLYVDYKTSGQLIEELKGHRESTTFLHIAFSHLDELRFWTWVKLYEDSYGKFFIKDYTSLNC